MTSPAPSAACTGPRSYVISIVVCERRVTNEKCSTIRRRHRPAAGDSDDPSRERFGYSSPFTRPPLKLPGTGRMIVWPVVNVEEWEITRPVPRQLSSRRGASRPCRTSRTGAGTNTGCAWVLAHHRALQTPHQADDVDQRAGLRDAIRASPRRRSTPGWEFMAHAYVQMPIHQIEDQRAMIRQTIDVLKNLPARSRPAGSDQGAARPALRSITSPSAGFNWFGDWVMDDQPFFVKTKPTARSCRSRTAPS